MSLKLSASEMQNYSGVMVLKNRRRRKPTKSDKLSCKQTKSDKEGGGKEWKVGGPEVGVRHEPQWGNVGQPGTKQEKQRHRQWHADHI